MGDRRFGVLVLPDVAWPEMERRVRHVEELGFGVVATADHLVDWTGPTKPWFEAWTTLAAMATVTESIRLTTLVTQIPMRNPALLAHQAATVDHISGGRLEVGLGTGLTIDPTNEMMGIENWSAAERVARLEEYVQILGGMLSQPETTFEGAYYDVVGATTEPLPVQSPRPPIMLAAMGPKMLRIAAEHADIWNQMSFAPNWEEQLEEVAGRMAMMDGLLTERDRGTGSLLRSYLMFDPEARAKGGAFAYYASPDVFADRARSLLALGIDAIDLYYPVVPEQVPAFEEIARDVLPELLR